MTVRVLIILVELYTVYALNSNETEKVITDMTGSGSLASFIIISLSILLLLHAVHLTVSGKFSGGGQGGGGFFDGDGDGGD